MSKKKIPTKQRAIKSIGEFKRFALRQRLTDRVFYHEDNQKYRIDVNVRYDDCCGNGYNSFAITAEIFETGKGRPVWVSGGCQHEAVVKHFPKLVPFLKWHLCSAGEPMYYVENSLYWAGFTEYKDARNIEHLKSTCIYGAVKGDEKFSIEKATKEQLVKWLESRKVELMKEFRKDMERLGFTY
jgi:hypothetical protein